MKEKKPMQNLKRIRKRRGLTQKQLAEAIGIKWTALSEYERGTRRPNYTIVAKLCKALGVPLYEILSDVIEVEKLLVFCFNLLTYFVMCDIIVFIVGRNLFVCEILTEVSIC